MDVDVGTAIIQMNGVRTVPFKITVGDCEAVRSIEEDRTLRARLRARKLCLLGIDIQDYLFEEIRYSG